MFRPDSAFKSKFLSAGVSARQLAVYRNLIKDPIYESFAKLLSSINFSSKTAEDLIDGYFSLAQRLLAIPVPQGFRGDAWQYHLISLLLQDENPFSRRCETVDLAGIGKGLQKAAALDLRNLANLAALDAKSIRHMVRSQLTDTAAWISELPSFDSWPGWDHEKNRSAADQAYSEDISLANKFSESADWSEILPELAQYYKNFGTGIFASYHALRWVGSAQSGSLEGIAAPDPITFESLFGYRTQRKTVVENTEKFVKGLPANNILLYGERGTGKSSTVKALLHQFGSRGLRLVEVPKHSLADFPQIIDLLSHRHQKFIIFVDDLSFEESDAEFTYLKAVLEGGLAAAPPNILVYATSNRRHLIKERFSDRENTANNDEIRIKDTMQEKLSLADRFGITVTFTSPGQGEYLTIVDGLAKKAGLTVPREELHRMALEWELQYNGRSGRTARQFVNWLIGEKNKGF